MLRQPSSIFCRARSNFGLGGDYTLEWGGKPEVTLDLEIKPQGVTVYAQLLLTEDHAGIEISHIGFQNPSADPDENTAALAREPAGGAQSSSGRRRAA